MREVNLNRYKGTLHFGNVNLRREVCLSSEFTYAHFNINNGSATVGGGLVEDKFFYGVSFCSPEDNFSKRVGRELVIKNLIYNSYSSKRGVFFVPSVDIQPAQMLRHALLHHLHKMRRLPDWAKNPVVTFRNARKARLPRYASKMLKVPVMEQ